jgi:hypothetical protein
MILCFARSIRAAESDETGSIGNIDWLLFVAKMTEYVVARRGN